MSRDFLYKVLTDMMNKASSGSLPKEGENKILINLCFVDELLNSEYSAFLTEEDYNLMSTYLYSLYGKYCMIPYPKYQYNKEVDSTNVIKVADNLMRVTERNIVRKDTSNNFRIV